MLNVIPIYFKWKCNKSGRKFLCCLIIFVEVNAHLSQHYSLWFQYTIITKGGREHWNVNTFYFHWVKTHEYFELILISWLNLIKAAFKLFNQRCQSTLGKIGLSKFEMYVDFFQNIVIYCLLISLSIT